jgi:hypothetical protein
MKINIFKCNNCGDITEDFANKNGWIRIIGVEEILICRGKDLENKYWINKTYDENEDDNAMDFCSKNCLISFFDSLDQLCEASS